MNATRIIAFSGIAFLAIVAVILVISPSANQAEGGNPANLQGLRALTILIEDLEADAASEQITKKALEDQVLVTLRSKAPALTYDPGVLPYLYVNLTFMTSDIGYTGTLTLELNRPVEILVGVHRFGQQPTRRLAAMAPVWDAAFTLKGPKGNGADHVRRLLDRLLEEFLADYFRANP